MSDLIEAMLEIRNLKKKLRDHVLFIQGKFVQSDRFLITNNDSDGDILVW